MSDADRFALAVGDRAAAADAGVVAEPEVAVHSEVATLVAVARRLRAVDGATAPDPAFTVRLRERLVSTAAAEWAATASEPEPETRSPVPARAPKRWQRTRYALAGGLAAAIVVTGLVLASRSALPGDALYPVKRGTERVAVAFAFGQEAKGRHYLGMARTRAEEVRGLLDRAGGGPGGTGSRGLDTGTVSSTFDSMDRETAAGTRLLTTAAVRGDAPGPLDALATWTADQRGLLAGLLDRLPAPDRTRAADSLDLLQRVAEREAALRGQLSCSCLDSGGADDLGPRPCSPCAAPAASGSLAPGTSTETGAGPGNPARTASPGGRATGGSTPGGSSSGGGGLPLPLPTGSNGLPLPSVPGLPVPTRVPTTVPTVPLPPLPVPTTLPSLPIHSLPTSLPPAPSLSLPG